MMRRSILAAATVATLMHSPAWARPDPYASALADPARPAADMARDADRKPAGLLAWAGVKLGDKVGEYMPGGGYFTRILAKVVGPKGKVYAFVPGEIVKLAPRFLTDAQAVTADPAFANVVVGTGSNGEFGAAEPLDIVWTSQNYHDLHGKFAPEGAATQFNAAVMKALKPGGLYVVIDHAAPAGSGLKGSAAQHRIDREAVVAELTAAGFQLVGETDALAKPSDSRTTSIFDPSIRGKTDQFALKFRKPN